MATPETPLVSPAQEDDNKLPVDAAEQARIAVLTFPIVQSLVKMGLLTNEALQQIVEKVALADPSLLFQHMDQFIDQPFADQTLVGITAHVPEAALQHAEKYRSLPSAAQIRETAARTVVTEKPEKIFEHATAIAADPFAQEVFMIAATQENSNILYAALNALSAYAPYPWAETVVKTLIDHDGAWDAFYQAAAILQYPFAERVLRYAANKNPKIAVIFIKNYATAPFAEDLLLTLIADLVEEKRTTKSSQKLMTLKLLSRNDPYLSFDDFKTVVGLPFEEKIFAALEAKFPHKKEDFKRLRQSQRHQQKPYEYTQHPDRPWLSTREKSRW